MEHFWNTSAQSAQRPNSTPAAAVKDCFSSVESLLPSIGISKRRLKQLEAIHLIRDQREKRTQDLAFHTRPFVLCGLPLRRPPQHQFSYTRQNDKFLLQITGHPKFGLPFGQDRLIPIRVATRVFASTIFFGTNDQPDGKLLLDWARFHFFDRLHLWFTKTNPP